ncbi:MAG: hypothetical protein Q8L95_12560 [Burkholderiales bacterium]|nr:hypothetical protein [Burkholderiales bacterium]
MKIRASGIGNGWVLVKGIQQSICFSSINGNGLRFLPFFCSKDKGGREAPFVFASAVRRAAALVAQETCTGQDLLEKYIQMSIIRRETDSFSW